MDNARNILVFSGVIVTMAYSIRATIDS
jgi:hypothetical protein